MFKKIKICYIISSLANEGPVNVLYNIIKYLDFDRFNAFVVTLVPEKQNSRLSDFKEFPIELIQLAPSGPLTPINLVKYLLKEVNQINPELIHAHCPRSLILMSLFGRKYKKSYTAHIYPGLQQKVLYGKIKGSLIIRICNFLMLKTDLPIACSNSVSQQFKDLNGWNIKAIDNGCSLPIWERNLEEKNIIRERLGLKKDVKYFIFIGRFSKEKKPDFIIETFRKIGNQEIGLIMLGDGPLFDKLKQYNSEQIRLEGFKTNIYEYLIASDYYLSASEIEGLANTLLESMTIGLPMLLSDIPSHRDVIENTKHKIGLLFNNSNANNLISNIDQIITWDAESTAQMITNYFSEKYTAQSMSQAYQYEYLLVLDKKL